MPLKVLTRFIPFINLGLTLLLYSHSGLIETASNAAGGRAPEWHCDLSTALKVNRRRDRRYEGTRTGWRITRAG
jgi:hypothetical protein